ncbi:hypothetical protein MAR_007905 [Mya arenaria]|uniref:Uncharacterized protein n=1 Tax=Mya arenaria TaxID=6604 RepID=A0ABY7DXK3_MYAAR|nr:hypothetical protein MAR_007905 [Mya arenaria]
MSLRCDVTFTEWLPSQEGQMRQVDVTATHDETNVTSRIRTSSDCKLLTEGEEREGETEWVKQWILKSAEHGLYDKLMVELRNEDPRAFKHFMRMPPAMFDEVVQRLTPRLTKQDTNYRASLESGLKVAITLQHLASGNTYRNCIAIRLEGSPQHHQCGSQ